MAFGLASCAAKPELDIETAAENLEDEDYRVHYQDDKDLLEVGVVERLSAYEDDDDITITKYADTKYAKMLYNQTKQQHSDYIEGLKSDIKRIEYILEHYDDDLESDEIDEYEDELKDLKRELKKAQAYIVGISGSVVWSGTEKAIEKSKG